MTRIEEIAVLQSQLDESNGSKTVVDLVKVGRDPVRADEYNLSAYGPPLVTLVEVDCDASLRREYKKFEEISIAWNVNRENIRKAVHSRKLNFAVRW